MTTNQRIITTLAGLFGASALCVLVAVPSVSAARLYFQAKEGSVAVADTVAVELRLDSEGEYINAVEAVVEYPRNLLRVSEVRDGNSIVPVWIERTQDIQAHGALKLSGVFPGGYSGDGVLAAVAFQAVQAGQADLSFDDRSKVFLNTPDARTAATTFGNMQFVVVAADPSSSGLNTPGETPGVLLLDYFPPESFSLLLGKTELAFDNQWFLSFIARDTGGGIDRYEVRERKFGLGGMWREAVSPLVLHDQSLFSVIEVKAIDKTGLERMERLIPLRLKVTALLLAVIIAVSVAFFCVRLRSYRRRAGYGSG